MQLTRAQRARLYIETAAAVQAALVQSRTYRERPQAAAHIAREHAESSVRENRIGGKRK
ncbi:MAG: hypothetical protein AB7E55_33230 [Pigmentiphaga sp.]